MRHHFALVLLALWIVPTPGLLACSMCSCGDPSGDMCTGDFDSAVRWVLKLETRYLSKQNESEGGLGMEHHRQTQMAAATDFSFASAFEVFARIPFVSTTLWTTGTDANERFSHSGIGDAEVMGRYMLPVDLRGSRFSLALGAKLPTGNNELKAGGERLTEHTQLGTGSWDGYSILRWCDNGWVTWAASVGYRYNGANAYGQRYGRTAWAEATAARNLNSAFQVKTGLRFRDAARDATQDGWDENSGGTLLAALVESRVSLGSRVAMYVDGEIPVAFNLGGTQVERPVLAAGLAVTL